MAHPGGKQPGSVRPRPARQARRTALSVAAGAALMGVLAACSSISSSNGGAAASTGSAGAGSPSGSATATAAACSNAAIQPDLYAKGQLTVATDSPAYSPWFENNQPANGQGYESAVAYAIGAQLGFSKSQVKWVVEPFDSSYAPGPKKFDFDVNEISYSAQRAQAVSFSDSYFDVQQSLIALKGSAITTKHSPADLKGYVFGDQIGTTSLSFINGSIQPTQTPKVFDTLNDVAQALGTKQIAAFVTDTPTAQYIASSGEIPKSVVVGQFPSTGEHYGLLFAKGDPLVSCVNQAIATLKSNGTLASLQKQYLQVYLAVPTIAP
jgi:polar amino acid transport system substrate-binding protein